MLNIQLFSADTTILLIFHMFCPWNHKKLPSKVAYFSKIAEFHSTKNLLIQDWVFRLGFCFT